MLVKSQAANLKIYPWLYPNIIPQKRSLFFNYRAIEVKDHLQSKPKPYPTIDVDYAQTLIVVVLVVVKMFGFSVITRSPCQRISMKIGGNRSYKPPGAF